jgi:hypothetical protein
LRIYQKIFEKSQEMIRNTTPKLIEKAVPFLSPLMTNGSPSPCSVLITSAPEWILTYKGRPCPFTKTVIASGSPPGGTYHWSSTGEGTVFLVSGQGSNPLTIRGGVPGLCYLEVKYTVNGCEAYDCTIIKVRRPASTTMHAGNLFYPTPQYIKRYYYHRVKDQYGDYIDVEGIYCSEKVKKVWGEDVDKTSPGETSYWGADGDWQGGIAVRDAIGCPTNIQDSKFDQSLKVGYYSTTPDYYIWLTPSESNVEKTTQ